MNVEKVVNPEGKIDGYILVDSNYEPIQQVNDYLKFLKNKNYSPNTFKNYAYDLKHYFKYLESIKKWYQDIEPIDIVNFIGHLRRLENKQRPDNVNSIFEGTDRKQGGGLSGNTINRIISTISSFYDYEVLHNSNEIKKNPIPKQKDENFWRNSDRYKPFLEHAKRRLPSKRLYKVKVPEKLPRPIEKEKIEMLLESLKSWRDKSIILLMLQGGLRIGEVLGLRFEDINYAERKIIVTFRDDNENGARAKNMNYRIVDFAEPEALQSLSNYIMYERPIDSDSPNIFLANRGRTKGKPLTYQGIYTVFDYHCNKLGIKTNILTMHGFRHTHATKMWQGGMRELALQKRLGHKSLESTKVYTKVEDDNVKEEYLKAVKK